MDLVSPALVPPPPPALTKPSTLVFFCCDISASSISSFTPTILKELGWTASKAQVMSIPIWITGIVFTLSTSYLSDKLRCRYPFILLGIALSIVGWAIQLEQVQPAGVRYFSLFAIASGAFMQMPILIGWLAGNLRGRAQQAVGCAIQLGIGNCANFVSSNVFIKTEAPKYPTGFAVGLAFTALGAVVLLLLVAGLEMHNRRLDQEVAAGGKEIDEHDQVRYKYIL